MLLQICSVFYFPTNVNSMTLRFLLSFIQHYLCGCYEKLKPSTTKRIQKGVLDTPSSQYLSKGTAVMSLISKSTARRLNQWTNSEFGETYEMAEFIPKEVNEVRSLQAADQCSTSRPYQRSVQKFKSYRDSDSEIDSEVEVHLFGQARKPTGYPEASNAWIQNGKSEDSTPIKTAG